MQQYNPEVDFSLFQRKPGVGIPTSGSQPALPGLQKPRSRRRRRPRTIAPQPAYSITGTDDCAIIGHTEGHRDLSGCTTCLDCGVKIFCPVCLSQHPTDTNALAIPCQLHEEGKVKL